MYIKLKYDTVNTRKKQTTRTRRNFFSQTMSIGRDTLKATMKRTWNAIKNPFRRQTIEKTQLQDDYPTDIDSEFTDDEEQRREWQQHLNRRATIATEGMTYSETGISAGFEEGDNMPNDKWDYVSEYSVTFPSDNSIIDAFKENQYKIQAKRHKRPDLTIENENELNSFKYCMKDETQQKRVKRRMSLRPYLEETRNDNFATGGDTFLRADLKPVVREIVHELEKGPGKRRDSLNPYGKMVENISLRRESSDRESESEKNNFKRKVRKQIKQRKRAQHISPDESDVESIELMSSKYTVNITMDEIRDLIKKNVSSAVKTIADKNMKEKTAKRCISPIESFSTESETIFSGSSQSTDTQLGGLLQKQMNAQLDKNKLSGQRRASFALGYLNLPENMPAKMFNTAPISPVLSACHEQPPQVVIHDAPQQPHILVPDGSQFNDVHHLRVPQVTFNMNDTQATVPSVFQFPAISTPRRKSIMMHSARRPSILPNADNGTFDPFNPNGQLGLTPHGQLGLPNSTPQLSPSAFNPMAPHTGYALPSQENPFITVDNFGVPQDSINRLRMRRHTLATGNPLNLGLDQPMGQFSASPLVPRRFENPANPGIDPRLDQLDYILKTLDASINNSDKTEAENKNPESARENATNAQENVNVKGRCLIFHPTPWLQ